jgi:hypothetical protein
MKRAVVSCVLFCLCAIAADKKPDVQILEFSAKRDGANVTIDGSFRVTGQKAIKNVVLAFDFFAGGRSPIATKQYAVDEPRLVPGDESGFHLAASAPASASEIRVRVYREAEMEVSVGNGGPHPIAD